MYCLVIFLLVACASAYPSGWSSYAGHESGHGDYRYHGPVALPPGYDKYGAPLQVLDTPEVAAKKAEHLAIHQATRARSGHGYAGSYQQDYHDGQWRGEGLAESQDYYGHDQGHSNYLASHYASSAGSGHGYAGSYEGKKWQGPIALPPGYDKHGAPLPVQDLPEVAHEKAARLHELAKAGGDTYPAPPSYASHATSSYPLNKPLWNSYH